MSQKFVLEATARDTLGKGASRRLRKQNLVPAVIYGADEEPVSVTLIYKDFIKLLEKEAFFSSIITVQVDGVEEMGVIKALQRHPSKGFPMHADFMRIRKGEEITMKVPVHFVGTSEAPGVQAGGMLDTLVSDVEITTLPKNLPEFLEVDVSNLEAGQALHLSDLVLTEGVKIAQLLQGNDHDQAIAIISTPRGVVASDDVAPEAPANADDAE